MPENDKPWVGEELNGRYRVRRYPGGGGPDERLGGHPGAREHTRPLDEILAWARPLARTLDRLHGAGTGDRSRPPHSRPARTGTIAAGRTATTGTSCQPTADTATPCDTDRSRNHPRARAARCWRYCCSPCRCWAVAITSVARRCSTSWSNQSPRRNPHRRRRPNRARGKPAMSTATG